MNVIAVTVTYNRTHTLKNTIQALLLQEQKVDRIIVVDNCSKESEKEKLRQIECENEKVEVIWLNDNLGGAGGFYYGMKYALEKYNPKWYWIMDDDAYPTKDCLKEMLRYETELEDIGFLAPAIYGIDRYEYQMYHHKILSKYKINDITAVEEYLSLKDINEIEANAFVGPMFSRKVINEFGLPKKDLFIYGDDTEYTYRITRKYKGYVIKNAIINHQDPPIQGNIVIPEMWWKEYYTFRNRFLFIDSFAETYYRKVVGKIYLVMKLMRKVFATALKRDYKGFRIERIKILIKSIRDGLGRVSGKTIDPNEYIMSIKKMRNNNE